MSGIAGVVSADGERPDAKLLERIADALTFRGPDARSVWKQPGAGFCFTFLRTGSAPQSAKQPCTLDGKLWLLADGRLDGRDDLRWQLEGQGCTPPKQATDEELILHAWRVRGEGCLEFLRGDFAFALWDSESRSLWCVRDPIGARPFFYTHTCNRLFFSNTLDVVRLAPEVSDALDPRAIGDFLLQGWWPDAERTIFREVQRLPAGHVLHYSGGHAQIRRYAQLPIEEPLELRRPEEYVEAFREVLRAAVRDRLPADSVGVFLSGGLDSSSVAAISKALADENFTGCVQRAFTVDYRPLFDDEEGRYASRAASHIGIPLETLSAGACAPYARWGSSELRQPEPCHEPFLALQIEQYRQAAAHARVVFSGDGGDSVLDGQAWPDLVFRLRRMQPLTLLRAFGGYLLSHGRMPPLRGGFRARLRRWLGRGDAMLSYPLWLSPDFEQEFHLRDRWRELQLEPPDEHPLHPQAYRGLSSSYWPSVLEGEDAGWTGVPVELRTPFLDWRVLQFLLRVPPVPWCMQKELLRRSMRGLLPNEIQLRPKTPLQGDPLVLHVQRGDWRPLPLPAAVPAISTFVNWTKLQRTLTVLAQDHLWLNLQPVSLNYWLKTGLPLSRVNAGECG